MKIFQKAEQKHQTVFFGKINIKPSSGSWQVGSCCSNCCSRNVEDDEAVVQQVPGRFLRSPLKGSNLSVGDGSVFFVPDEIDLLVVLVEDVGTDFHQLRLGIVLQKVIGIGHVELKC